MKTPHLIIVFLLAIACSKPSDQSATSDESITSADTTVNVVIWNEVGVRDTPSDKGKYLTSIYLGEQFDLVGDTASELVGSKRNHYHKIRLSDGSTGWVRDELVAFHVVPAAIMSDAIVCKRPDIATVTDQTFLTGDFVVVRKVEGNFVEVTGKMASQKWFTNGYIGKENISFAPIETEYAALSSRAYNPDTKENVRNVLLVQLQNPQVFGQSILWDRDYNTGAEYSEGEIVEEDPTDTTAVENN